MFSFGQLIPFRFPAQLKYLSNMNQSTDRGINIFFLSLILAGIPLNIRSNCFYDNEWTVGEWLISYQGGFVRRGLPGDILYGLASNFKLNPIVFVWLASGFSYALLSYLLFRFCKGKLKVSIILSPMILLAPVIGDFFIRKDVLAVALYGLSLLAIKASNSTSRSEPMRLILVNIISIIAILSHESYGFWALPSLLIIYGTHLRPQKSHRHMLLSGIIALLPAIAVFVFCLAYKGSAIQSLSIHQSWQNLNGLLPSQGALSAAVPTGAIDALGWTVNQGLKLSFSTLNDINYIFWIPAVWMMTIYIFINIFIGKGDDPLSAKRRAIVLFQFLAISPLFILGWDYGRWIFLWLTSSALLYGFSCEACINTFGNPALIKGKVEVILKRLAPGIELRGRAQLALLFIGIPACCWSLEGFLLSTPIGYSFGLTKQYSEFLAKVINTIA